MECKRNNMQQAKNHRKLKWICCNIQQLEILANLNVALSYRLEFEKRSNL